MKKNIVCFFFFLTTLGGIAEESGVDIRGIIEWDRMQINSTVTVNLPAAGIRIPTERFRAEALINTEYPRLIRPYLLSLPMDSSETMEDMINRGELPLSAIGDFVRSAGQVPPALSADLVSMFSQYTMSMYTMGAALIRHRRPAEIPRTLTPVPTTAHTGIIIIADKELPVHGRNIQALPLPCFFPKIWDTEMNLIFERNMLTPEIGKTGGMIRYVSESAIFRPTPSGLDEDLLNLVGPNPLRIIARGVFGIRPTDPIIDREDALLIISSEENRRLLREGKVVLVLHRDVLKSPIGTAVEDTHP
ncbi:polymerase [Treponema sp. TIM-1]|uniref:polymerase n=1 Tax=Treponema sp. TIM-1 TaxID=2898417 RepID=UPI00397F7E44